MSLKIRFVVAVSILFAAGLLVSSISSINAQGPAYNYGVFDHAKHETALTTTGQQQISCDTCHKRDAGTEQLFYPGHDACIQCHVPQFTTQTFDICAVCHKDVRTQGRALLDFPAERTDYGVIFDGAQGKSQHVVHMNEALPNGEKMTCAFCHKSQGTNQAFPSHPECYVCHTPGANSKAATAQLASCDACHKTPGTPNTEMKRLISTRRNDALPYRFRHSDHIRAAGCMECHRGGGKSRITETSCGSCHGVMVF